MSNTKRVSVKRPAGSRTSSLRARDGEWSCELRFNRAGMAKARKADAELMVKKFPTLEIIEEEE